MVEDEWERGMWEYFVGLYKHCNQGIKGRGKERARVGGDGFDGMSLPLPLPLGDGVVVKRRDSIVSSEASVGWS